MILGSPMGMSLSGWRSNAVANDVFFFVHAVTPASGQNEPHTTFSPFFPLLWVRSGSTVLLAFRHKHTHTHTHTLLSVSRTSLILLVFCLTNPYLLASLPSVPSSSTLLPQVHPLLAFLASEPTMPAFENPKTTHFEFMGVPGE